MKTFLGLLFLLSAAASHADTLVIPVGSQGIDSAIERPQQGQTQSAVEAKFGAPAQRTPAVGQPPITRWDYPQFTVYFESDRVIRSVLKTSAKPLTETKTETEESTDITP